MVKCFDTSTPGIQNFEMELDQRSSISLFHISVIRHFGTPVVKYFDTSTPGIWNSEMESDQRSGISSFHILAIRHFDTPVVKCFDTSTLGIQDSEMELFPSLRNSLLVWLFKDFGVSHFTTSGLLC
jgi:hypothetical protein